MKAVFLVLSLAFLAIAPAAAVAGHHGKGVHGNSYNAPGHVKKRLHMQSARGAAHMKY